MSNQVNFNCVTTHQNCFVVVGVVVVVAVVDFVVRVALVVTAYVLVVFVSFDIVLATAVVVIIVGPRNLALKYGHNQVSNSWNIVFVALVVFVVDEDDNDVVVAVHERNLD